MNPPKASPPLVMPVTYILRTSRPELLRWRVSRVVVHGLGAVTTESQTHFQYWKG